MKQNSFETVLFQFRFDCTDNFTVNFDAGGDGAAAEAGDH